MDIENKYIKPNYNTYKSQQNKSQLNNNSYHNISKCLSFYSNKAFYIDTPWFVKREIKNITYHNNDEFIFSNNMTLVGSAEQGFLSLEYDNSLINDVLYISVSPCFRDEPVIDYIHKKCFLKAELYYCSKNIYNIQLELYNIMTYAFNFFSTMISSNDKLQIVEINENQNIKNKYKYSNVINELSSLDILLNDIEIGSYGVRHIMKNGERFYYIYGTALAEPRFSTARL